MSGAISRMLELDILTGYVGTGGPGPCATDVVDEDGYLIPRHHSRYHKRIEAVGICPSCHFSHSVYPIHRGRLHSNLSITFVFCDPDDNNHWRIRVHPNESGVICPGCNQIPLSVSEI
jgi:hypothetical protein